MNARAALANLAWLAASAPAHGRFVRALRDPAATQEQWLHTHLARNAKAAYARAYDCGTIRSYAEFAQRVPIVDYDELEPWITRIRRGESSVLTRERVTRLVPTSGSAGARKLIPFTASLQREFNAAIAPWIFDLCRRDPAIAFGPAYWSVTPLAASAIAEESAVPIGFDDDSRYLGGPRAWLVNAVMAVPSSVRHIGDLETFRRTVLLHLLAQRDLRVISIWHPSFLSLLLDTLARDWDFLCTQLSRGRCSARANALRAAAPTDLRSIWPTLRVVSSWADARAAGPAAELQQRLSGVALQPKGLLATEAFVSIPFGGERPLAIQSHLFEFADQHGAIHPAWDLRVGESYDLIVTTGGGCWRYRLGDRVEVTGWVARTPSLRFVGRGGNVSDCCGEKLSDAFVAKVLGEICPRSSFAMLAPERLDDGWRYALFVEGETRGALDERLDAALRANPHYDLGRNLGQLSAVRIATIEADAYQRYVTAEMTRGVRLGDIKPRALSPRTDWATHLESPLAANR